MLGTIKATAHLQEKLAKVAYVRELIKAFLIEGDIEQSRKSHEENYTLNPVVLKSV